MGSRWGKSVAVNITAVTKESPRNSYSNVKRRAASVGCGVALFDWDGLWVMGDRGRDRLTVRSANDSAGP